MDEKWLWIGGMLYVGLASFCLGIFTNDIIEKYKRRKK